MRSGLKRALSVMAIFAIALHAVLWAAIPFAAASAASADPFSVICHSAVDAGDQNGDLPGTAPSKVCEHCALAAPTAGTAPEGVLAGYLGPALVLHWLEPAAMAVRRDAALTQKLPRGPPHRT